MKQKRTGQLEFTPIVQAGIVLVLYVLVVLREDTLIKYIALS